MLAKIKFDGKEHLAIVLNEYTGFDEIHTIKEALKSCLCIAATNPDIQLAGEELYEYVSFLCEIESNAKQMEEMHSTYFEDETRKKSLKRNKVEKKDCEIYF